MTDLSDHRKLVGFTEHVFLGRVVANAGEWNDNSAGEDDPGPSPFPLFTVEMLHSIKGELPAEVTVIQHHVGMDNPERLQPGREYVFATNPSPNGPWQIVIPQHGSTPVNDASRERVVEEFERAYAEQIPYTQQREPTQ